MRKGLSVLLIAAALFGFYGGAVNLNDVLACKDYWEVKGEETTADMNKLEDGVNQLKENEQAYLDGLDAVKEGEEALAKGEADYAAGLAELAKGEADYAAGKAKLDANTAAYLEGKQTLADKKAAYEEGKKTLAAKKSEYEAGKKTLAAKKAEYEAGKKALAANKSAYEDGKKSLPTLKTTVASLQNVIQLYNSQWHPGFTNNSTTKPGLSQARSGIENTFQQNQDAGKLMLVEGLLGKDLGSTNDSIQNADSYESFNKAVLGVISDFNDAIDAIDTICATLSTTASGLSGAASNITGYNAKLDEVNANIDALSKIPEDQLTDEQKTTLETLRGTKTKLEGAITQTRAGLSSQVSGFLESYKGKLELIGKANPQSAAAISTNAGVLAANTADDDDFVSAAEALAGELGENGSVQTMLKTSSAELDANVKALSAFPTGYEALKKGKDAMAGYTSANQGIPYAFAQLLANPTVRPVLNENASELVGYMTAFSTNKLDSDDLDEFDSDMNLICSSILPKLIGVLNQIYAQGVQKINDYEEGQKNVAAYEEGQKNVAAYEAGKAAVKQYEDGMAQIAEYEAGLAKIAEYEAGERELAAGAAKLADGRKQLAEGKQKLEDGRKELADGKEKLAEYEDGEQQVRDGLATLVSTQPDGGLTSILERLDGDKNFDNPNGHLLLDKGLGAVDVGRGYQADSGELITEEITKRAIGTAAGFAAAALALLAGILSLLKKNKGAGVAAIITAIAGAVGIGIGTNAGMEFSHIAGSTIETMPWVAAGILAVVAAAHAIVHFTGSNAEE